MCVQCMCAKQGRGNQLPASTTRGGCSSNPRPTLIHPSTPTLPPTHACITPAHTAQVLTDLATGSLKSAGKGGSQVSDAAVPVGAARPAARVLPSPVEEEGQDPIGEEGRGHAAAGLVGQEGAGLPDGGEEEEAVSSKRRRMEAGGRGRGRHGRGGRGRGGRGGHEQAEDDGDSGGRPGSSLHVMAEAAGACLLGLLLQQQEHEQQLLAIESALLQRPSSKRRPRHTQGKGT